MKRKNNEDNLGLTRRINKTVARPPANGKLVIKPSNCQHMGSRENQEDAFAFSDFTDAEVVERFGILAVVADGMGGLEYGEEASRVALASFLREYSADTGEEVVKQRLTRATHAANTAVYELSLRGNGENLNLGTTLIAAVVLNGELCWVSVGDSRIYLFRDGVLKQLTLDHIYANHLKKDVELGRITPEHAEQHPERAYLTSYLGLPEIPEICLAEVPLTIKCSDRVILSTDGLHDTLSGEEIAGVIECYRGSDIAGELVATALDKEKRYQDNITVAVLAVDCD